MYETIFGEEVYHGIISEFLFLLHITVIIFAIFIGLFVSFPVVLLLVFLHRLHIFIFKEECVLSKLQKYLGALPKNMSFLQFARLRLFGRNISLRQSNSLDYVFVFFSISIAFLYSL